MMKRQAQELLTVEPVSYTHLDVYKRQSVNWAYTADRVQQDVQPLFDTYDIVVTQGFIAATDENESTTLGRDCLLYTSRCV